MKEKRYQIVKYADDIGADEGMDFVTMKEAITEAKRLLKDYESIFIYDYKLKSCRHAFNGLPSNRIFANWVNTKNTIYHWTREFWK